MGMDTGDMKELLPVPEEWDLGGKVIFETIYKPLETGLLKKGREEGADPDRRSGYAYQPGSFIF